ncbi:helix-turn-helix domain-containing protein [Nocardia sp. CA-128927]|uniref:helix-turn-helix domain-containing protein n=1 Tax=Nocardia sp. CA-128927 TaxID=3239975 RepID=UPI003D97F3F5
MAIVLDTDQFDPRDRADVVAATAQAVSAPAAVVHTHSDGPVYARFDGWQLGQLQVLRSSVSGLRLTRTSKQIRNSPSSLLAIQLQQQNTSRLTHAETQYEVAAGQLAVIDFDLPYHLDWRGGKGLAMFVPRDHLGLSADTIHAALIRPQHSPLYGMVTNHIALMGNSVDMLEADAGASTLGDAFVEMTRAFLTSAATLGSEDGTAVPQDILLAQIREYVRRQLSDPDLSPATIARAHHISIRYLYTVCARAGLSPEQWIITQRLDRARGDLARFDTRHRSIAAIAYSHGFRSTSHFARRFRAAYGMTARDWRREALEQPSSTGRSNTKGQ